MTLCIDGFVVMLEVSVFGFRPKWASNGVIFVVEFGISLMLLMILATRFANVTGDQLGSTSSTANRLFIVCINFSIMPVPLWSPAGARNSFIFLFLKNNSNSFTLKACAWSHLIERGIPWSLQ